MARGGYGTGQGVPLRDRVRAEGSGAATPAEPVDPVEGTCPARHCWVTVPADATETRPGLLLEWRQVDGRFQGLVCYPAQLRPGAWAAVTEWIPAELLAQA